MRNSREASDRFTLPNGVEQPAWLHRTELIIYAFLFTCISSGLIYLIPAALDGKVWNAIVGAATVIGGSGAALIMQAVVRVGAIMVHNSKQLEILSQRVDSLEDALEAALTAVPAENAAAAASAEEVDRATAGAGDPSPLVAGSASAERFPRLAAVEHRGDPGQAVAAPSPPPPTSHAVEARWQEACEHGDLRTCRRILAEAGSQLEPARRQALADALARLIEERKRDLRDAFAALVRAGQYREAIEKGREIAETFPNSAMAAEFHRLQPHLASRAGGSPPRAAEG